MHFVAGVKLVFFAYNTIIKIISHAFEDLQVFSGDVCLFKYLLFVWSNYQ